jgi:putative heme-binding domain-containing protein
LVALVAVADRADAQGAVSSLRRLLESGRVPAERQGTIIEMICARGEADDLAVPFKLLTEPDRLTAETRRRVAELLLDAAVTRKVKPSGNLASITKLIDGEMAAQDRRLQATAIRLAAMWRVPQAANSLQGLATSDSTPAAARHAAIAALATIGGNENRHTIEQLVAASKNMSVRIEAAAALARLDTTAGAQAAADLLASAAASDELAPLLDALLGRQDGSDKLAKALAAKPPSADAAKLALRHMYSVGRSDAELSDILSRAAGIALDAPPPSQEEVAKIVENVLAHGDAARGEKIFRRADVSCLKCHAVAGAGGSVGPDLSPVGSISPPDYIVNSILNPNLAIKEQFVTRRVLTTDGEIVTGIQVDRDDQRLRLRDAAGNVVSIPIDNIEQEDEGKSLMPQGLTKFLTQQEFYDLARFVSELGKPGPYAIRKPTTLQRWRVLKHPGDELTSQAPNVEIFREQVLDASASDWQPAYATVGGTLPLAELAAQRPAVVYLQGELEVSQAGPIALDITTDQPTQAWLDAEPFESSKHLERPLDPGRHTITLRIEVGAAPDPQLKVEVTRPANSAAQFVIVGGM